MIQRYYEGTSLIINLISEIGKLLGIVDATYLRKPQALLRKENKIKTIQSSLGIEGNSLSVDQVSALFENKRVIGPVKDIMEVQNAITVYQDLSRYEAFKENSYLEAHERLMNGLVKNPGQYRNENVGIFKGDQMAHLAPPSWNVPNLMNNLFIYLKDDDDNLIIKSCVFHYEMEFIHPFMDGNGRIGRLWQTIILMNENPIFEFLPIEKEIKNSQQEYYEALARSDKEGLATRFIEYMLKIVRSSLDKQISDQRINLTGEDRILYFKNNSSYHSFTRKEYMEMFKDISSATATRDLRHGVQKGILNKRGENRNTAYTFIYIAM